MDRPYPPKHFIESYNQRLMPAPDLKQWAIETFMSEDSPLFNPDHDHLIDADIEFMWASHAFEKKGRTVLGQCEQVMLRAGGWQGVRLEQQFYDWFKRTPKFLITLAGDYCDQCSDLEFCALVEHELMHIAHAMNDNGVPKFNLEGQPVLAMRGHDVEEFISIVKRYGASGSVKEMTEAAKQKPMIGSVNISKACGTCLKAVS